MATDVKKILNNLLSFYDFTNKTIITVGAGGGQFIEYGRNANNVIAIDNDEVALAKLHDNVVKAGLIEKFTLIHSDFESLTLTADVVLFEFCLHEMQSAFTAVSHAKRMANDIIISDHYLESDWAYIVSEEDKVFKSWNEIQPIPFRKLEIFDALQVFTNYEELFQKVHTQGEQTIQRIELYKTQKDFSIPMKYAFAWL